LARTLIRNATIVSMRPNVDDLPCGDMRIDGSQIAAISGLIAAEGAEIIDASYENANPGLTDAHRCPKDERPLAIHGLQDVVRILLKLQRWVSAPKTTLVIIGDVGAQSAIEGLACALLKIGRRRQPRNTRKGGVTRHLRSRGRSR
jgi:hypothetical protein